MQERGDIELPVTGQQSFVDHGVLQIHRSGEISIVDLDAEWDLATDFSDDVLRQGPGPLQMHVVQHDATIFGTRAADNGQHLIQ